MFPEQFEFDIADPINRGIDWLVTNYGDGFEAVSNALLAVVLFVEQLVRGVPWWVIVGLVGALAWHASRRLFVAAALAATMVLIGLLGLWDLAMQTLALMTVSVAICVLIGLPVGILLARHDRARAATLPVLDAMQTLPSFVYLVPALMLFGLGKVPALFATVIYATPPMIRLTDLGLRQVERAFVEVAADLGAGPRRRLIDIELPLARPSIMAGVNQTIMMALAMVVIASMIGARGLGEEVLLGIQRLDVGRGLTAGIAIVALAIVVDRITQAYGRPR